MAWRRTGVCGILKRGSGRKLSTDPPRTGSLREAPINNPAKASDKPTIGGDEPADTEHGRPVEQAPVEQASPGKSSAFEVFRAALRLGLMSFGGPVAHLGYFREDYVVRRKWLDEQTYVDLVALCQFLPGPASSEVGMGIGILRAGLPGGLAAWLGFTLPSAILLTAFAYGVDRFNVADAGWVHGLKLVAVAVVAQAVWGMSRQFCTDRARAAIAVLSTLAILAAPGSVGQVLVIALAALVGWRLFPPGTGPEVPPVRVPLSRRFGVAAWVIFFGLLLGLQLLQFLFADRSGGLALFTSFYSVGSLVFGGGHVVLPLLQAQVVPPGWVTNSQFLAGYGAAQAVPGPLFTFSAFLGAVRGPAPNGIEGAAIALVGIFLPAFLLITGSLPFWEAVRQRTAFRSALAGVNAAVVGILLAALYNPVWTGAVFGPADFGVVVADLALLMLLKWPPWAVVLFSAMAGELLSLRLF